MLSHIFNAGFLRLLVLMSCWVGLVLNGPTAWGRLSRMHGEMSAAMGSLALIAEVGLVVAVCLLIFTLLGMLGRMTLRVVGVVIVLISAACSYYMSVFDVVIGFGVIRAIFTTDHDMSSEAVGLSFWVWFLVAGLLPAWYWWRVLAQTTFLARKKLLWLALLSLGLAYGSYRAVESISGHLQAHLGDAAQKMSGVISHVYVPTNWMVGSGMVLHRMWADSRAEATLVSPVHSFKYQPQAPLDDVHVILVIGETARSDRFGLLGHSRPTTPRLAARDNLAAFAGLSCDTSTKLSLACMFVRPEGITKGQGMAPDIIHERMVFSVFKHLGFEINILAMQSEVGFYGRAQPDFFKIREVISAQPENAGKPMQDALLLPELARVLNAPQAQRKPRLTILHTKGSHYLYTNRYPREFAKWGPECGSTDVSCSTEALLNSFDNSILYTDFFLDQVFELASKHRALVLYTSDHGESIGENLHFHATPRSVAPPEQRWVPLLLWASQPLLKDPVIASRFAAVKARSQSAQPQQYGHHNLFASMLSCLGIDSPNGGITPQDDLCRLP